MKRLKLKTYEGFFSEFYFPIEGSDIEDAEKALLEWCDKYTSGYKLERIYELKENESVSESDSSSEETTQSQ